MEIKRYTVSCYRCPECGCESDGVLLRANSNGSFVQWSAVEPLLKPLTDEQVRRLAHRIVCALDALKEALAQARYELEIKELTWKEADAAGSAAHADYIEDCRAALKEVGR